MAELCVKWEACGFTIVNYVNGHLFAYKNGRRNYVVVQHHKKKLSCALIDFDIKEFCFGLEMWMFRSTKGVCKSE